MLEPTGLADAKLESVRDQGWHVSRLIARVLDGEDDIDHRLGGEAWDRRGSHVLEDERAAPECGADAAREPSYANGHAGS